MVMMSFTAGNYRRDKNGQYNGNGDAWLNSDLYQGFRMKDIMSMDK